MIRRLAGAFDQRVDFPDARSSGSRHSSSFRLRAFGREVLDPYLWEIRQIGCNRGCETSAHFTLRAPYQHMGQADRLGRAALSYGSDLSTQLTIAVSYSGEKEEPIVGMMA